MHKILKSARRNNLHGVRREKPLDGSNMGGMGPCPLPSCDVKALDFTFFCADGRFVVVRFVTTCSDMGSCV